MLERACFASVLAMKRLILLLSVVVPLGYQTSLADDWPQWFGPQRDGIWREVGIVEKLPIGGPELVWKAPIGTGYAGPAVSGGRVYVFDRTLADVTDSPDNPFKRGEIPGKESLHCLESAIGKVVWSKSYDTNYTVSYAAGPRCTPVIHEGLVYTLGAEGRLFVRRVGTGDVVWEKDFVSVLKTKTPTWGFAATPLIEDDLLICLAAGDGSTVVAYDKKTGEERWRALGAKEPGYCPPRLLVEGDKRVLLIWHPEAINGLDPKSGKVLWTIPWKIKAGLTAPTPRREGKRVFFTSFYNGATMLEFVEFDKEPKVMWQTKRASEKRTEHLNSIMGTPVFHKGHLYGNCSYGQFRCLKAETGERLWESLEPVVKKEVRWGNVFVTPHEDRYFLFNEQGELLIGKFSPQGYEEISRAKLIEPDGADMRQRSIVWSHPAYANQCIFVRNDSEIKCFSLKAR